MGERMLGFINDLYSDDRAGTSTIEIGGVDVEEAGIEGAMAWAFSFPVLVPCLFFRE